MSHKTRLTVHTTSGEWDTFKLNNNKVFGSETAK